MNDECAILYTSGTTGKPKGCILDNRYTPLPLFYINTLACSTMAMVLSAGCVIQLDRFHPRSWWANIGTSGATIVHYLGVMPAILLGMEADAPVTHSVRFGYGANVDPKHQQVFEQRFSFPLIEGWAMTETGGTVVIASSREPRHAGTRCFGRPRSGMEVKLVDAEYNEVASGVPGHMLVRWEGPHPRLGFFAAIAATEAACMAARLVPYRRYRASRRRR